MVNLNFFLQSGFLGPLKQVKRVKNDKFSNLSYGLENWYITYFYRGEHDSELKFVTNLTFSQILMVKDQSSLLKNKMLYSSEGHYIIPCNEACNKQTFDWNVLLAWKDLEKSRVAFSDTPLGLAC